MDKTLLVDDLLKDNDGDVYLFTRPRRFGKTTNISMLEEFFDIKRKGTTIFDGFEISKPEYSKYDIHKNAYNVIRIDLKNAKSVTMEEFLENMSSVLKAAFLKQKDLLKGLDLSPGDTALISRLDMKEASISDISESVLLLTRLVYEANGLRSVVLIDEYDAPINSDTDDDTRKQIVRVLTKMMTATFKGNEYLQLGVITGVRQIAKESMFSGLNNIIVNNILSTVSDERYGFTESEVKSILDEADHPEQFSKVKEWYDGYRFGDAEVYNPFSIINYVKGKCGDPKPYWVNTSFDVLLRDLIVRISERNAMRMTKLLSGESITEKIDMALTLDDIAHYDDSVYSVLATGGYLNARSLEDDLCELSIPNKEVHKEFSRIIGKTAAVDNRQYAMFCNALLANDLETMRNTLENILLKDSMLQLPHENVYGLILVMVLDGISEYYDIKAEEEDGLGRSDVVLHPKVKGRPSIIFELKRVREEKELPGAAERALEQIHEKRYYAGMTGDVLLIGLSFWKKFPYLKSEVINMERDWKKLRPASED